MKESNRELFEIVVQDAEVGSLQENYYPVRLTTSSGYVNCRYYPVDQATQGVIWVGGVGGGWDTPAQGLYPQLALELHQEAMQRGLGGLPHERLHQEAIASLRVRYRYSTQLKEAVLDVLAGISYLLDQGITKIALVGHSFGGAVVIQAAAKAQAVRTVVTLATQVHGTKPVPQLATRCSLLLLHGEDDPVLSPECSQRVYNLALEPKHLILYPGANHGLDEVAQEVHRVVREWIVKQFNQVSPSSK